MSLIDSILEKYNLKYEDLTVLERETLYGWINALQTQTVTIEKVKDYVATMRDSVNQEVSRVDHNSKQDIFLKARLRNLLLLEAFLTSPEKAKEQLDRAIAGIIGSR